MPIVFGGQRYASALPTFCSPFRSLTSIILNAISYEAWPDVGTAVPYGAGGRVSDGVVSSMKGMERNLSEGSPVMRTKHVCLWGCVLVLAVVAWGRSASGMELSSPAFADGGDIPVRYAMPGAGGSNASLPLVWKGEPDGTKSFAISIVDIHPVAKNWVHWIVVNIPAQTASLQDGASGTRMPDAAVELMNSYGTPGYGGPQPPEGTGKHPYVITVYALGVDKIAIGRGTDLQAFRDAVKGKVLAEATIRGFYGQ